MTLILTAWMAIGGDQGRTMVNLVVTYFSSRVACIASSGEIPGTGAVQGRAAAVVMLQACEVLVPTWWANASI